MLIVVFGVAVLISGGRKCMVTIAGIACVDRRVRRCFPALWRLAACVDDCWHCLHYFSGPAAITADIEVLGSWLQNQPLLVIRSLINL